jgi:hypothetical protein
MNNETVHVYHGSRHVFDEFAWHNHSKEGGIEGAGHGMYFSTSQTDALTYGEIVYMCTLRLGMPLSNHDITLKPYDVKRIGASIGEKILDRTCQIILEKFDCDTDVVFAIGRIYKADISAFMAALASCGYTHTEDKETPDLPDMPHYIVYDLSKISIQSRISFGE